MKLFDALSLSSLKLAAWCIDVCSTMAISIYIMKWMLCHDVSCEVIVNIFSCLGDILGEYCIESYAYHMIDSRG